MSPHRNSSNHHHHRCHAEHCHQRKVICGTPSCRRKSGDNFSSKTAQRLKLDVQKKRTPNRKLNAVGLQVYAIYSSECLETWTSWRVIEDKCFESRSLQTTLIRALSGCLKTSFSPQIHNIVSALDILQIAPTDPLGSTRNSQGS
eukprot:2529714-Amphidinium_carterae.2